MVAKCPVCPSMWSSPPDSSVGGRRYDGIGAAAKKAKVELRNDVKKRLLKHRFFVRDQFELIARSGELFNFDAPSKTTENLIQLTAEMAANHARRGKDWLINIVLGLNRLLDITTGPITSQDQLQLIFAAIQKEKIKRKIYGRLAELIRAMLDYDELKSMVSDFFDRLIKLRQHEAIRALVMELRFAPNFDAFKWLKRVLDEGGNEDASRAYIDLLGHAKQSRLRIYDVLEMVHAWLPASDHKVEKYGLSHWYALLFIVHYAEQTTSAFQWEHHGVWPSKYPLFAALSGDREADTTQLQMLASWLTHPGMEHLREHHNINYLEYLADLIERWYAILHGLGEDAAHEHASEIADFLIRHIVVALEATRQEEVYDRWRSKVVIYEKAMLGLNMIHDAEWNRINRIQSQRKAVMNLAARYVELRSMGTS